MAGNQPDFDGPPLLGDMLASDDAAPPAVCSSDPLLGCVLADRYLILRTLGDGGMGSVYMAEQTTLQKPVALKVLKPEFNSDAGLVERFFREARATAAIRHENVVDILDFGQTAEYAFFAMEPLSGCELADIAGRGRRLDWDRSRAIILQVVRALAAAHAAGIIHRDMKPQNVFLIQRNKTADFVKILDFGIAKIDDGVKLTQAGMVFGTAAYMAPEQATGAAVDGRTDMYAIGCMLFEMLTGQLPFPGDNFMTVLTAHIREPAPRLRDVAPNIEIPAGVEQLVARMMAKHPVERFADMGELERALLALDAGFPGLDDRHSAGPPMIGYADPGYDGQPPQAYSPPEADNPALATMMMPGMGGASLAELELERLPTVAYLFVAFAHGTDGVLTNDEMRVLAHQLRAWAPQLGLEHIGAVLRDSVATYGREPNKPARLHEVHTALAAALEADRLEQIVDDLRAIAGADGGFSAAEQQFIAATAHAFGLAPEPMVRALAFIYLALAHATDGAIDAEEMRVLGEQLRQWAPEASLAETGESLREAVAEYKRFGGIEARLDRARTAANALKQSAGQDTLRRVLADLWRIAGADGHISAQEQRFIMEMVELFNS